ncbi:hypothetical protein R84981_002880 [Carnimonas sp. R-84981]|uniref:glycoside hydrolase family 108 protein n=1 Tax=Carnimonas bestiolae TaxID=3402172 RepID=UPI003EDBCB09
MPIKSKAAGGAGIVAIVGSIIFGVSGNEGGHVNDPHDPGGETNHGITENVARAHGYKGDMRDLSVHDAASIYYSDYVAKPGYDRYVETSPAVATKLVDGGVNVSPRRESRWLQTALNSLSRGGRDYPIVAVDGIAGEGTARAFQSLIDKRGERQACELTIKLLDAQQAVYYMGLPTAQHYIVGWVDNRIGNVPLEWCSNYPVAQ